MIVASGILISVLIPFFVLAPSAQGLAAALFLFGAGLGSLDVAMNIHAVEAERLEGRPLMSGFHGLFSLGGIAGSGLMTLLLSIGVSPLASVLLCAGITLAAILAAWPRLLAAKGQAVSFALPKGMVLLLAGLCAVTFLVEGAILDWGALFSIERRLTAQEGGGLGYLIFSAAMTLARLTGDGIVAKMGSRSVLVWGGLTAASGFILMLLASWAPMALFGFFLVGMGCSNLVPVLFSSAGRQTVMPPGLAIAAVTTTGYAGLLVGPAAVGAISHRFGLSTAFWLLAGLICLTALTAKRASSD